MNSYVLRMSIVRGGQKLLVEFFFFEKRAFSYEVSVLSVEKQKKETR
jgi:hypothetical protein